MRGFKGVVAAALCLCVLQVGAAGQSNSVDAAKNAYEKGDYKKAIEILSAEAQKAPNNGEVQLLLTKAYLESNQYDNAISSGEKAVSIEPNNSLYHQWLGEAYGQKADHVSMFSAYSWARKTQKEFATAVQLDDHNFDADQDLVEYDCTAPSMVGGGEDKAEALIQKMLTLDPAEGHFAQGVCKAVKKDYAAADVEYAKALELKPKTADRVYDIGDYFLQRGQGDKLLQVAAAGETLAPQDPRGKYYQAVGWILSGQNYAEAEQQLRQYLTAGPMRSTYPAPWDAHYWLGRLDAAQKNTAGARSEYQEALKLNPKYKKADEALKQVGGQ
ncbi:MAG TPA: tetratricopeptide repeat protein [Verrucomicrobiae bacterium]|nr:tetratricopeptide repeat protein [Verrucomicrobiae bacterium]